MANCLRPRRKAFTIVELLLSVVVLGILVGFAITKLGEVKERAYIATMMNDLRVYAHLQEQYHVRTGTYTDTATARSEGFRHTEDVSPLESQESSLRLVPEGGEREDRHDVYPQAAAPHDRLRFLSGVLIRNLKTERIVDVGE